MFGTGDLDLDLHGQIAFNLKICAIPCECNNLGKH